jgi:hypothetical protein
LRVQYGQAERDRVRSRTLARHSCDAEHTHQHMREELATTSAAVSWPFFSGCHSRATRGKRAARLLVGDTFLFAQYGQPAPRVLLFGLARQTWSGPAAHRHQIIRPDPELTSSGVSGPFRSLSHSPASCG